MWRGMHVEMAGYREGQEKGKDGGREESQYFCFKKTNSKLRLFAEAYSSWMVVTVWKISEWERDGHGRAVKYPGMKIPTLREGKREGGGKADLLRCAPWMGMAEGLGLQESVTGCRPAGRGINLNGISLLLLFLLLLLLRLLFSSSTLSASQPFSSFPSLLGSLRCFVKHCRRGRERSMAARRTLNGESTVLRTPECSYCASVIL